jgi:hypothetical protein
LKDKEENAMPVQTKTGPRYKTQADRNTRRRELRAKQKEASRKIENYTLMVEALQVIDLELVGDILAREATWLSDRITLTGWFVMDLDSGTLAVKTTKEEAQEAVGLFLVGNPRKVCVGPSVWDYNSERFTTSKIKYLTVGSWKALCGLGWTDHLYNWLRERIKEQARERT